jgi:hypothetical protein
MTNL